MIDEQAPPSYDDRTIFDGLYRSHYPTIVRLAGLLAGDRDFGEEIAQDAFARLYEVVGRIDDPPAYLRATVVNLARSRVRRLVVRRRHVLAPIADSPGHETAVASRLDLRAALGRLPDRQREAVVLRYYGDLTDVEVAAAMDISPGAVKSHLHRAVAALAARLEDLR
jgi:RNA polymerase sigma-70 factor (sigma-E family)